MKIDSIISEGRQALPEAFTTRSDDAHRTADPIEMEGAELMLEPTEDPELDREPFEIPPPGDPFLQSLSDVNNFDHITFPLPGSVDEFSDSNREEASETEANHRELGFEIFACYVSFHTVQPEGKWGIFYRREGIRRLALLLMSRILYRKFQVLRWEVHQVQVGRAYLVCSSVRR